MARPLGAERSCRWAKLFRRRRQRRRVVRQGAQIGDHVGALAVLRDAGKAHRRARDKALGTGDEFVEVVIGPGSALGFHGGREIEPAALAALLVEDAVKVRTDAVGAALFESVAGPAFL